jgi:hypothetical protein
MLRNTMVLGVCATLTCGGGAAAEVISGTYANWVDLTEGFPPFDPRIIGDGVNHVTGIWSLGSWDASDDIPDAGYLYGSAFTADTEAAFATGIDSIEQIADASIFDFTDELLTSTPALFDSEKPSGIGDFVVLRNINTGHYGVVRMDDVYDPHLNGIGRLCARLDVTWWFQTDGSGDFSIPGAPTSLVLLGAASLGSRRRRAGDGRS